MSGIGDKEEEGVTCAIIVNDYLFTSFGKLMIIAGGGGLV